MSTKITYAEIIEVLSRETGFSKEKSKAFTKILIEQIIEELQENGKASITNFGSFKVKEVAEREGQNPQTGEPIVIPAHRRVSFTPYKALKEEVNAIYSHLETELIDDEPSVSETEEVDSSTSEPELESKPEPPFKFTTEPEQEPEPEQEEEQETEFKPVPGFDSESEPESEFEPEPEVNLDPDPKPEPEVFTPKTRPRERTKGANTGLIVVGVLALVIVAIASIWFLLSSDGEEVATAEQTAVEQSQAMTGSSAQVVEEEGAESAEPANAREDEAQPEEIAAATSESEETEMQEEQTPSGRSRDVDFYMVHEDEWYWVISRNTYGKAHFWPLIFRQNYTVNHHPDSLEKNVRLEIPILEGSAENPTKADYRQLAAGAKMVSEAYQKFGRTDKAEEYARFARRWERAGM